MCFRFFAHAVRFFRHASRPISLALAVCAWLPSAAPASAAPADSKPAVVTYSIIASLNRNDDYASVQYPTAAAVCEAISHYKNVTPGPRHVNPRAEWHPRGWVCVYDLDRVIPPGVPLQKIYRPRWVKVNVTCPAGYVELPVVAVDGPRSQELCYRPNVAAEMGRSAAAQLAAAPARPRPPGSGSIGAAANAAANNDVEIFLVHPDHLGAPRAITRLTDNKLVWRNDPAEPFGNSRPDENPSGLGRFVNNIRGPGLYYDEETNTVHNHFRTLDPRIGRYLQSDPIGLKGGLDTYGYVDANPLSNIDPLGLLIWKYGSEWKYDLDNRFQYFPRPGSKVLPISALTGAATSLNWSIGSLCICSAGGYKFDEFIVDVKSTVHMRNNYPPHGAPEDWIRRAEQDHLDDLGQWAGKQGKNAAMVVEAQWRGREFNTLFECQMAAAAALQYSLGESADEAIHASHAKHDGTRRHTWSDIRMRRP